MIYFYKINREDKNLYEINICDYSKKYSYYCFEQFFDFIKTKPHHTIFICDELKNEGSFVLYKLKEKGFSLTNERNEKKMKSKTFTTLFNNDKWFQIKIKINKKVFIFRQLQSYTNMSINRAKKSVGLEFMDDVDAMASIYKNSFSDFEKITIGSESLKRYKEKYGKEFFDYCFPELDDKTYDDIQQAVRGGINYIKEEDKKYYFDIYRYDNNSEYPAMCMSNRLFPYGKPKYEKGEFIEDEYYKIAIIHISAILSIKKDHFPCITSKQFSEMFEDEKMIYDSSGKMINMWITNIDLENIYENYDVEYIEFIEHYKFLSCEGSKMFGKYFFEIYENKKNAKNPLERFKYKMLMNNLIGQFAKKRKGFLIDYDNFTKYETKIRKVYNATTAFVTAYARQFLLENAYKVGYKHVFYMDTDSIHTDIESFGLDVGNEIGQWKLEGVSTKSIFIKRKCYAEKINNEWDFKCAGITEEATENMKITKFYKGSVIPQKILTLSDDYIYNYNTTFITL